MAAFKNIMCVVTPEPEDSLSTVERAVTLAQEYQARLVVAEVIPRVILGGWTPDSGPASGQALIEVTDARMRALQELVQPFQKEQTIQVEVLTGTSFIEIIRATLRNGHDLVIKPAEHPSFLDRMFGSDDMHLLRKCPCPVWLTHRNERPKSRRVLAAVDFDPQAPDPVVDRLNVQILQLAAQQAQADQAQLHIVHAWSAPGEVGLRIWNDEAQTPNVVDTIRLSREAGLEELAEPFAESAPVLHLVRGRADKEIPALARKQAMDLVVMGTVARTGIAGLLIGNTAEAIINQLDCSLLAVKPEGFESPVRLT